MEKKFSQLTIHQKLEVIIREMVEREVQFKEAIKEEMATLRDDGVDKIRKGVTTIEELMRETSAF